MRILTFSAVLALVLAAATPMASADERRILLHTSFANAKVKERHPKPKRTRFMEPNFAALDAPSLRRDERKKAQRTLTVALFDDTVVHIDLEDVERNAVDAYVWTGRIEGDAGSSVVIVVKERALVASISTGARRFMIEPVENGHEVLELDLAAFPNEGEPISPEGPAPTASAFAGVAADAIAATDAGSLIEVLVVYTDDLRAALGGTAAAQAAASSAIAATNVAYQNSGVIPRVRLAGTSEVAYEENGFLSSTLSRLRHTSDGFMDEVHTLRDQLGADDVAMLVLNGGGICGTGYLMDSGYITNPSWNFAVHAFNVTANSCAVGNLSFPHELGHNFGLAHDRYVSDGISSRPYAFGYVDTQWEFRDIMAYGDGCGFCPRIQYFSNPNITYLNRPLGVSYESSPYTSADNVRALNSNASIVANWRQSVTYAAPSFTDDPIAAGVTTVKAVHINELRTAIDNYRAQASLGAYTWPATISAGTPIAAAHITELRTALTPALQAFARTAIYTNSLLAAGDPILAVHIQELRDYVK